jgi:hypothetical protein
MGTGSAGGGDGDIRSGEPQIDGNLSGRSIGHQFGNGERTDAVWPHFQESAVLFLVFRESADAGTDDDADAVGVFVRQVESRLVIPRANELQTAVFQRTHGGDERKLSIAVESPGQTRFDVRLGIEVMNLPTETHTKRAGVEQINVTDAAAPGQQTLPEIAD